MVMEMPSLADAGRRLSRRLMGGDPRARRLLVPVLLSALAVLAASVGVVLATGGTKPAGRGVALPSSRPAPARTRSGPVVPLLGENTEGRGKPMAVPVASTTHAASTKSAPVAPLRGLRQKDLLVVAPFSLSGKVLAAVSRLPAVTSAEPLEAAKIKINGVYTAVLGVNPSTFRGYAARAMATSSPLWQGVAQGGGAGSHTMGTLARLSLGGTVTAAGRTRQRLPVVAFGTVGIGGVDAVVSDSTARAPGGPAPHAA